MGRQILPHLFVGRSDIARYVEVVVVCLDVGILHELRVMRHILAGVPNVDNAPYVAFAQAVLRAILGETFLRVDHEDAFRRRRALLVEHDHTSGDARAKEKIGRQPDDALYPMAAHDELPYLRLGVAAEQNAMRQNHGGVSARLHRLQYVQQKGIVAALQRRYRRDALAMPPAPEGVFLARTLEPALDGKRRIGNYIVECAEFAVVALVQGIGQRVAMPEIGIVDSVHDHRHARHADGGDVLFLSLYGDSPFRLRRRAKEKRPGTASRIVNRDHLALVVADANHLRHYAAHFGRRVELAFRLA